MRWAHEHVTLECGCLQVIHDQEPGHFIWCYKHEKQTRITQVKRQNWRPGHAS